MNLVPEIHALRPSDLATLRAVSALTLHRDKPSVLAGLCLEPGGRVVVTDGRRIVFRTAPGLAALQRRIVVGPCWPQTFAGLGGGHFQPNLSSCRFEDEGGGVHEWPLVVEPEYPAVDSLLSIPWEISLRFPVAALRAAWRLLEPLLEPRHPALADFPYSPTLRLRIRPAEQTLLLETDQTLGYSGPLQQVAAACAHEPGWRHEIELRAAEATGQWPEPERIVGLNGRYLMEALDALEAGPTDEVWLRWQSAPDTPVGVISVQDPDQRVLIMPVRLSD